MTKYEFRAVPCPQRAQRSTKLPKGADAFAETLNSAINDLAVEGWDYVRTDTVEVKTRRLLSRRKENRSFLVFRREIRPLIDPRPIMDLTRDTEKVRARRVKSQPLVQFVRSGGRKITPNAADPAIEPGAGPLLLSTAAE